ncbi:MAG: hypothetical protein ACI93R_002719 [Flavobacteriales bacterium]|jgi:hypothetical protein
MLKTLNDTLHTRCLIALSYFDIDETPLKQSLLAGKVIAADDEDGITIELEAKNDGSKGNFILPANLSCWFKAPPGNFPTSQEGVSMLNPDYLITWDIYKTQKDTGDGEQQWWEWVARTDAPSVGA